MSAFGPISSASPPASDIADNPGVCEKTQNDATRQNPIQFRASARGLVEYMIIIMEGAISVEDEYLEFRLRRRSTGASNSARTDPGDYTIILTVTDDAACNQLVEFDADLPPGRVATLIVKIEPSRVSEEKLAVAVFLKNAELLDDEELLE
jgi:hypothetical protein